MDEEAPIAEGEDASLPPPASNHGALINNVEVCPTTYPKIAEAEADLEAQDTAESDILSYWNKNTGDAEDEAALLDKLNERLAAEDGAIRDAMGVDDAGDPTCEADCEDPIDEEDVVLIVE